MAQGIIILPSYYEALSELPDDLRLAAYDGIIRYGLYGEMPNLPTALIPMFALIRPSIDASLSRYRAVKERCKNMQEGEP